MYKYKYKYLGSGSYGCVITPSHSCDNNKKELNEQNISKLFNLKQEWEDEIIIQQEIEKNIDPNSKFTVKMINNCSYENKDFLKDIKDFYNCDLINANTPIIYQINYENGGIDLFILVNKYYKNINIEVFKSFINIFEGVSLLNSKNICHHDIKLENIVYNSINNKFSLIDFGLMTLEDKIYTTSFLLSNKRWLDFYNFPPEYSFIYNALHNDNKPINILNINSYKYINYFEDELNKIKIFLSTLKINKNKLYLQKILDIKSIFIFDYTYKKIMMSTLFNPTNKDNYIEDIIKKNNTIKQKIDVYMLGLTLYQFVYLTIYNQIKSNISIDIPIKIFDLIKKMIDINPVSRISIENATIEYKSLFT